MNSETKFIHRMKLLAYEAVKKLLGIKHVQIRLVFLHKFKTDVFSAYFIIINKFLF